MGLNSLLPFLVLEFDLPLLKNSIFIWDSIYARPGSEQYCRQQFWTLSQVSLVLIISFL